MNDFYNSRHFEVLIEYAQKIDDITTSIKEAIIEMGFEHNSVDVLKLEAVVLEKTEEEERGRIEAFFGDFFGFEESKTSIHDIEKRQVEAGRQVLGMLYDDYLGSQD